MASVKIFAPAKINLFLHVTGRRPDGYHLLESLVAFADIGDHISVTEAHAWRLDINGPFGKDLDPTHANTVSTAAHFIAKASGRAPSLHITLTKNLPIASGIGGGSSDGAATLLACQQLWQLPTPPSTADIIAMLGADMPVCLRRRPTLMSGIGEDLIEINSLPACDIVLVNPREPLPAASVFKSFGRAFSQPLPHLPLGGWASIEGLVQFLSTARNDLTTAAVHRVPTIGKVIETLTAQLGCLIARMSGSGATCFGLFDTPDQAKIAATNIAQNHPTWWVRSGRLLSDPAPVN